MKTFSLILLIFSSFLISCTDQHVWMQPSSSPASVPPATLSFEDYIQQTQKQITAALEIRFADTVSPYLGQYSLQDTVEMRSPFQISKNNERCENKDAEVGFLLIHGLTDSPFLMKDIANSLHNQNPCALVRAVLLPGHGTVVGDSLAMRHEDWQAITEYGIRSFDDHPNIQNIYIAGFSTGTALAIRYLGDSEYTSKIQGLLLFSTAIKAHTNVAFLAPTVRHFKKWADIESEKDAARYESFSMNAGAEFYSLVKDINDEQYTLDVPVFMAVSADDATIDAQAASDFYCNKIKSAQKTMLWYHSAISTIQPPQCSGVTIVENGNVHKKLNNTPYLYGNTSHLGITIAPENPHYGVQGKYHNCKAYAGEEYLACQKQDQLSIFGEKNIEKDDFITEPQWKYLRRATFNPHYKGLESAMMTFIKNTEQATVQ